MDFTDDELDRLGLRRHRLHLVAIRDGAEMVWVPPGPFLFGKSTKDIFARPGEAPQQEVWLSGFFIERTPLSNRRFHRFVEAGGYDDRSCWSGVGWLWRTHLNPVGPAGWEQPSFRGDDLPAAGVSWYEADAYCRWAGRQLPTEAQWEKAARGVAGVTFPWGEPFPTSHLTNFNGRVGHPTPPGTYLDGMSPFGLEDMAGNVNNWCRDWYWEDLHRYLAEQPDAAVDPVVNEALLARVGVEPRDRSDRGGGFATSAHAWEVLTCAGRLHWPAATRALWHGFRGVIEPT